MAKLIHIKVCTICGLEHKIPKPIDGIFYCGDRYLELIGRREEINRIVYRTRTPGFSHPNWRSARDYDSIFPEELDGFEVYEPGVEDFYI